MPESVDTSAAPPAGPADRPAGLLTPVRLDKKMVVALGMGQFGNATGTVSMVLVSLPITVAALDSANKEVSLGVLLGIQSLLAIVAIPLFGALSDRCISRVGMRRPFIVLGTVVEAAAMVMMGLAPGIGVLVAGAVLASLGAAIFTGGYSALVPDQVPEPSRGRVMGLLMVMIALAGLIASIALPAFIGNQLALFAIPAGVMLLTSAFAVVVLEDRILDPADRKDGKIVAALVDGLRFNPLKVPDYSWAWTGKALVTLANALTTTYSVYLLTDHLHVTAEDLPGLITITGVIGLFTALGGAAFGSWLSDRLRMRKKFALYTAAMVLAGALVIAFTPNVAVYLVGLVIMGLGTGAYFPIDGAILVDVLPGEGRESGKYMGLMQVADRLPRSLGAFIAPAVLGLGGLTALGGYPFVYIVGGVVAIIGGLLVRKIKGSI